MRRDCVTHAASTLRQREMLLSRALQLCSPFPSSRTTMNSQGGLCELEVVLTTTISRAAPKELMIDRNQMHNLHIDRANMQFREAVTMHDELTQQRGQQGGLTPHLIGWTEPQSLTP